MSLLVDQLRSVTVFFVKGGIISITVLPFFSVMFGTGRMISGDPFKSDRLSSLAVVHAMLQEVV